MDLLYVLSWDQICVVVNCQLMIAWASLKFLRSRACISRQERCPVRALGAGCPRAAARDMTLTFNLRHPAQDQLPGLGSAPKVKLQASAHVRRASAAGIPPRKATFLRGWAVQIAPGPARSHLGLPGRSPPPGRGASDGRSPDLVRRLPLGHDHMTPPSQRPSQVRNRLRWCLPLHTRSPPASERAPAFKKNMGKTWHRPATGWRSRRSRPPASLPDHGGRSGRKGPARPP